MVIFLILVILLTANCLAIWFHTSFRAHILKLIHYIPDELFTSDEINRYLVINKGFAGNLLSCPICLATWTGAAWSLFLILAANYPWWFLPVGMFSTQYLIKRAFNVI